MIMNYEIPPLWNYSPMECMYEEIDNLFNFGCRRIALLSSERYTTSKQSKHSEAWCEIMTSSATFYHVELLTGEMEINYGPWHVDDKGGLYKRIDEIWGGMKPGPRIYVSPGFLMRYCTPSDVMNPKYTDKSLLKRLMGIEHINDVDLSNLAKLVDNYSEHHARMRIMINDNIYELYACIAPTKSNLHYSDICNKLLNKYSFVDSHDQIFKFELRKEFDDGNHDDECAICLISELYDLQSYDIKE